MLTKLFLESYGFPKIEKIVQDNQAQYFEQNKQLPKQLPLENNDGKLKSKKVLLPLENEGIEQI